MNFADPQASAMRVAEIISNDTAKASGWRARFWHTLFIFFLKRASQLLARYLNSINLSPNTDLQLSFVILTRTPQSVAAELDENDAPEESPRPDMLN